MEKPQRSKKLLLGVDIGTGSSKGVLTTVDGQVLGSSEQPHDLSLPAPGWAEHTVEPDPEATRIYDELYAIYRDLHPQTVEFQQRLAEVQARS